MCPLKRRKNGLFTLILSLWYNYYFNHSSTNRSYFVPNIF